MRRNLPGLVNRDHRTITPHGADGGALVSPGVTRWLIESFAALVRDVATPPQQDELTA